MGSVVGDIDVDCGGCEQLYELTIGASNDCSQPPQDFDSLEEGSVLVVTVNINPLNDNVPYLVNLPSYYVLAVIDGLSECRDCVIYAKDDDRITQTEFKFEILSVNASSPSLNISEGEQFT